MMVSDSVLSSSGVDMTATRELAEERTNHRCHVDARAVGAHGVGLKRSSACLNPQNPTGPYRTLLKRHRAVRYSTHTSAAFGRFHTHLKAVPQVPLTLLRLIWYACVRSSFLFSFLQIPCLQYASSCASSCAVDCLWLDPCIFLCCSLCSWRSAPCYLCWSLLLLGS